MSLSALVQALDAFQTAIDNAEEITPEMIQGHFDLLAAVDQKTDALISFIENMQLQAGHAKAKADAYAARAKSLESAAENAKAYAKLLLSQHPDLEFRGTKGKLAIQRTAPKLCHNVPMFRYSTDKKIPDNFQVPDKYTQLVVTRVLNTDAVKEAIKAGEPLGFEAEMKENFALRIKL